MLEKIVNLDISRTEATELIRISKNINKDYELLKKGYPIQYLIGYVNFYNVKIKVNQNVLIPRYETEYLVEKTLELIKTLKIKNPTILDLCTGSGCIAISLSKKLNLAIDASDISKNALEVAKENNKINETNVNYIESDLFNNVTKKYDVIISNPPYININDNISKIVKDYEPNIALFSDEEGLKHIKQIIKDSINYLKNKSVLIIEIGEKQGKELIEYSTKIFENSKIKIEKDLTGRDRYLIILNNFD